MWRREVCARRDVYIPETMICENDMYPWQRDVAAEAANSTDNRFHVGSSRIRLLSAPLADADP